MKLIRFDNGGTARLGLLDGTDVVDLAEALQVVPGVTDLELRAAADTVDWIALGGRGMALARAALASGAGRRPAQGLPRRAPIEPRLILCSGENYWDHRNEKPAVDGREPEFFLKSPLGVIGDGDTIVLDEKVTHKLDYEVELMVVIGKSGRHIPPARALDHIYGYTIMNDVTARDRQVRLRPDGTSAYSLGPGKSFDSSAPIGPCIVTADEIPDPQQLAIRSFVSGDLRQHNHTSRMIWGVAELVAFFSTYITLQPGVVISTGTPGGTGWGSDPDLGARAHDGSPAPRLDRYLSGGDEVVCEIEGIGALHNRVASAPARPAND
ncbi:MAG: fumarylacetoacetate hydrolase family protein [Piscinibacter sp.]|nr:fumarylacetoacetate hydrolase family protein [Piscinibacter sp.]